MSSDGESSDEWVFEAVMVHTHLKRSTCSDRAFSLRLQGMLKSEDFQTPINQFIEQNCAMFDRDVEHK